MDTLKTIDIIASISHLIEIFFIKIELHYNLVIKKNYPIKYVDKQIFKTILSLNIFMVFFTQI